MGKRTLTLEFDEEFYAAFEGYIAFICYGSVEKYATDLIFSYVQDSIEEANEASESIKNRTDPDDGIPF